MNLQEYMFPITRRPIAVHNGISDFASFADKGTYLQSDYQAIVRTDTNELISIVRPTYKIVPNKVLIEELLTELDKTDTKYEIDPSHSFCTSNRMRLQVTFKDIKISDNESDIALTLYLSNSYDMSEGIKMLWGCLRQICTNGMVAMSIFHRYYRKHTKNVELKFLQDQLQYCYERIPLLQGRISELSRLPITGQLQENVEKHLGIRMAESVFSNGSINQWEIFNKITYKISHDIAQQHRARYQIATSKIFGI